jgi:hypothetical protein
VIPPRSSRSARISGGADGEADAARRAQAPPRRRGVPSGSIGRHVAGSQPPSSALRAAERINRQSRAAALIPGARRCDPAPSNGGHGSPDGRSRARAVVPVFAVVANGCANHSFPEVGQRVPRPEPLGVQAEPRASSRSDRLRGGLAQASPPLQVPARSGPTADTPTPARPPEPGRPQDRAQPQQPARPSEGPPPKAGMSLTRGMSSTASEGRKIASVFEPGGDVVCRILGHDEPGASRATDQGCLNEKPRIAAESRGLAP